MHNIEYFVFDESINKEKIQKEIKEHLIINSDYSVLSYDAIRWYDVIVDNEDDAEAFIRQKNKGSYDQLAVKFYKVENLKPSARYNKLSTKISEVEEKRNLLSNPKLKQNSKFTTCKKCLSKLNNDYLTYYRCPICGNDMRLDTIKKRISLLDEKIDQLQKELLEEKRLLEKKYRKNAKVCWLVKTEYHS